MIHQEQHPCAGQTVKVKNHVQHPQLDIAGQDFRLEDWWDRVSGGSWMDATGNPACLVYAVRTATAPYYIPRDNEVVYGNAGAFGHLLHVSELEFPEEGE